MMSKYEFDWGVAEVIHRERLKLGWSQEKLGEPSRDVWSSDLVA